MKLEICDAEEIGDIIKKYREELYNLTDEDLDKCIKFLDIHCAFLRKCGERYRLAWYDLITLHSQFRAYQLARQER